MYQGGPLPRTPPRRDVPGWSTSPHAPAAETYQGGPPPRTPPRRRRTRVVHLPEDLPPRDVPGWSTSPKISLRETYQAGPPPRRSPSARRTRGDDVDPGRVEVDRLAQGRRRGSHSIVPAASFERLQRPEVETHRHRRPVGVG